MRFPGDVPVLRDGTVTLRPHRLEDLEGIYEQCLDPLSQRYTMIPLPYTRDDAKTFLARCAASWEDDALGPFAIESPAGAGASHFAGSINLKRTAPGIAEIGFGTHPAARGHGVSAAAMGLLLDWAFETQQIQTVVWRCIAGNIASWRVAWHNGFHFEGTSRRTIPRRGDTLDGWTATLLASDKREPMTRWLPMPRLADGHVVLREMRPGDEQRYLETVLDPGTDLWLNEVPFPRTPEGFQDHVRDAPLWPALGRGLFWAIADADTDEYVGGFGMFGFGGLDHNSAEVGYRSHPDARGRGYVSGALRLAIEQAFLPVAEGGYGLDRLSLGAGAGNGASKAVALACGFTETGRDRRCYRRGDDLVVDLLRFDLLAEEWRSSH
jgi:RimJ/RimL family protein N-acetyltransferase